MADPQTEQAVLLLAAAVIGFLIGRWTLRASRTRRFQNRSEALVSRTLVSAFRPPDYHLMNHVTIQLDDGTTQVDHILVARFGVFVIETKHYNGWIFANPATKTWTQVLFRLKFQFQNPIFQNRRHVRAVAKQLDFLPPEAIKSVIVFTGEAEFKTSLPTGVVTISTLVEHIRRYNEDVMSLNRLQFCVGRLETMRLAISRETDIAHIESLARRHRNSS